MVGSVFCAPHAAAIVPAESPHVAETARIDLDFWRIAFGVDAPDAGGQRGFAFCGAVGIVSFFAVVGAGAGGDVEEVVGTEGDLRDAVVERVDAVGIGHGKPGFGVGHRRGCAENHGVAELRAHIEIGRIGNDVEAVFVIEKNAERFRAFVQARKIDAFEDLLDRPAADVDLVNVGVDVECEKGLACTVAGEAGDRGWWAGDFAELESWRRDRRGGVAIGGDCDAPPIATHSAIEKIAGILKQLSIIHLYTAPRFLLELIMSLIKRVAFFVAAVVVAGCIMHVEHGGSNWSSGNDNDLKFRRAIDVTADQAIASLDFHVPYSSVTVTSNPSITRVRITGHVRELTENESSIEWSASGPKLVTHSTPPARFDGVEIEVPAGTNLAVFSSSGSVTAHNLAATQRVELNSAYGSIALRDCGAIPDIHLETSSGSVAVEKIESFHNLHIHSSYGSLEIARVNGDLDANLVARTSSGSIRMSGVRNAKIDADSSYGSVAAG